MILSLRRVSAMMVTAEADWTHCMMLSSFQRSLNRLSILCRTDQSFLAVTMQVLVRISSLLSFRIFRMLISWSVVTDSLDEYLRHAIMTASSLSTPRSFMIALASDE